MTTQEILEAARSAKSALALADNTARNAALLGRDPFELCEELEKELGLDTYAMNWPIGCGKEFKGVYDRQNRKVIHKSGPTL